MDNKGEIAETDIPTGQKIYKLIFTESYPINMFISLVCVNFASETRWYTNQEICTVDSSQVYSLFIRKGMVMSGIKHVRAGIKFVALFVEETHVFVVIGWYAKINE